MASKEYSYDAQDVSLNPLGKVAAQLSQYGYNAVHNSKEAFDNMTAQSWIRLVIIIGGWLLMRQYLIAFVAKGAVKKLEEDSAKEEARAQITPNELRGAKQQLEEQDEEDLGDGTSTDWGHKARVRQRTVLKKMLEDEEQRKLEEEEDKDIEEFLVN